MIACTLPAYITLLCHPAALVLHFPLTLWYCLAVLLPSRGRQLPPTGSTLSIAYLGKGSIGPATLLRWQSQVSHICYLGVRALSGIYCVVAILLSKYDLCALMHLASLPLFRTRLATSSTQGWHGLSGQGSFFCRL